ncbi:hypothetical protein QJS66_12125 [Kocuria rhizophila]|nr:hypothetical protein QJS66_12125 [Kocuria rhizophila]
MLGERGWVTGVVRPVTAAAGGRADHQEGAQAFRRLHPTTRGTWRLFFATLAQDDVARLGGTSWLT